MLMESAPAGRALAGLATALTLLIGPGLVAAAPASAATAALPAAAAKPALAPITLSLRDVPLRTALETLFTGTGLQHAVEQAVPNYPITLDIRNVPFGTALRTLLRLAPGVTYRKEGEIYIIGMRQPPAEAPPVEEIQPPEPTAAAPTQSEKIPLNYQNYQVMAYALGGVTIPNEAQLMGGGIGGGYGGGYGGGGYGGGGYGGFGGGGIGGIGGSLGGYGGGIGGFGGGSFGGGGYGGYGGGGFGGGGYGGGGYGGYGGGLGSYGGAGGIGGTVNAGPRFRRF